MSEHRYKIKWKTEAPKTRKKGFTKEEIGEGRFGCDAFIYISLLYPEDDSFSMNYITQDGRGGKLIPLDSNELFKVWIMFAKTLSENTELSEIKKAFCHHTFKDFINLINEVSG